MLAEMQEQAARRHQEIMDILSSKQAALPPGTTLNDLRRSSSSLSLLPPSPQIFSGRDNEQQQMIATIQKNTAARIAILGPGGIGKTSLALSVLHDHNIVDIFGIRRYFISCDAAITSDGLITIVAKYFNLEEKAKPSNAIIHYLNSSTEPALMLLDNFETPWEIPEQRSKVEHFLSLLANITHLSIVLTMRGVERPSKIRWTRPFLPPLQPLTNDAAEEIFRDIADISNDDPDLLELLKLTDNLPLAVTLMAHLAESETCTGVLVRWKQENTLLLSDGMDKLSSLEKSLSISISSPRMTATPYALELLSLLSLLPDGISEATLLQMNLPFDNVVKCRFILVSTSLAHVDNRGRVKALTPIREYIRTHHPPQNESLQSLNAHVHQILDVWTGYYELSSKYQMDAIWNELGNIYSILSYNLHIVQDFSKDEYRTVKLMISLLQFMNRTAMVAIDFVVSLRSVIKQLGNDKLLQGQLLFCLSIVSGGYTSFGDARKDLEDAYSCFESLGALNEQVMVIISLSVIAEDSIKAKYMARKAVSLAKSCSLELNVQIQAFIRLSEALMLCGYVNDALHILNKPETLEGLKRLAFSAIMLSKYLMHLV
ncbi:P-loop containing nucleoside triphosphate hydrolase protein [Crucibulum laeve]|uniref:P-loop containing nucleoside triphosphate hydrolase protein n=1 Tax=Crucibulum laeve TaxID=68775 RepID=A0A5C3LX98_9AGAR|nr:P-loop containing nucleoside triphosphate hydrolase protein [Crucibulum laeve]